MISTVTVPPPLSLTPPVLPAAHFKRERESERKRECACVCIPVDVALVDVAVLCAILGGGGVLDGVCLVVT